MAASTRVVGDGNALTFTAGFWTLGSGALVPTPILVDVNGVALFGEVQAAPTQNTMLDRQRRSNMMFGIAGTALTRAANATGYTANDAVSDNAAPGSVSALPVTIAVFNDQPLMLDWIKIDTNDTGVAGKSMAMHLFNSDPTASSGVVGGDNLAYSNKRAGYLGRWSGTFRTFSDGAACRFAPDEAAPFVLTPGAGTRTIWYQLQTLSDFTPVSGSIWTPTFFGRQGQA